MEYRYSVVVPAHNESATLDISIKRLVESIKGEAEIIIVENGSQDDTWVVAKRLEANYSLVRAIQSRPGKGAAILAGWSVAKTDLLMFIDADLSPSPIILEKLYDAMRTQNCDCAIADRFLTESVVKRKVARKLISRVWAYLASVVLGVPYADFQCGAKAIKTSNRERLSKETVERGWCFDLDLILWHLANGKRISRIAVEWNEDTTPARKSTLSITKALPEFLRALINFRKRHRGHSYTRYCQA
jgi:glycosyltransferase involved in cell wall biosynthesis